MAAIPFILYYIDIYYIRHKTYSNIQNFIGRRYFCFQLVTLFITVFTGSVSSLLHDFWHDPATVTHKFGLGLPLIADYFAILIISKMLFSTTQELSLVWPYINRRKFDPLFLRPAKIQSYCVGSKVPDLFMVSSIALVYSIIAPLISCFAFLYFWLSEIVFKRQLLFVYHNTYERGGFYVWDAVILFSCLGLALSHIIFISFFSIQERYNEAAITAILPGFIYLHYYRLQKFYIHPAKFLDRETAVERNLFQFYPQKKDQDSNDTNFSFKYRHPALLTDSLDAATVRARLSTALQNKEKNEHTPKDEHIIESSRYDERGLSIPTLRRQSSPSPTQNDMTMV